MTQTQPGPRRTPGKRRRATDLAEVRTLLAILVGVAIVLTALPAGAMVVIGHRGASIVAPENTIASVEAAYGRAWAVECDPRVTADGQFILMHNDTVDATTNGTGYVADLTLAQIRALDAGSKFAPSFAGELVPTLAEELSAAAAGGLKACLDIKSGTAAQYYPFLEPYKNDIEVHYFYNNGPLLQDLDALDDGFTLVALGSGSIYSAWSSIPSCVDKLSWANSSTYITAASVNFVHAAGKQIYVWTVNDAATMLSLRDMGVDGIVTDNPSLATALLNPVTPPTPNPGQGLPRKLQDGLMMNWSFDDGLVDNTTTTAVDAVHGVDASLASTVSMPGSWLSGSNAKLGGALNFDGSDDYASVPAASESQPTGNAVTIAAWVKLDALPAAMDESYGSIYDSAQDSYVLYLDKGNNELRFKVTAVTSTSVVAAARPGIPAAQLNTTQWHHVVAVYDGGAGVARIYLNGNLVDVHADDSSTGSDDLVGAVCAQLGYFGLNGRNGGGYFDGRIDETAVWDRALGKGEIAYLYNGGAGRTVLASNPTVEAVAPVVRLEFENNLVNQGSGGATYDGLWINGASGQAVFEPGMNGQSLHLYNPQSPTGGDAVRIPVTLADAGTISFWCKPDSFYDEQTLFDNSGDANNWEMWISAAGVAEFRLEDGSQVSCDLTPLGGSDNWYHMAVTWFKAGSDAVLNLYVDGLLRDVDEGAWVAPGSSVYVGGGNVSNDFANATFDDFRVYDTMLSTDEIAAIFAHAEAGAIPQIPGDATRDGVVDAEDANRLSSNWGKSGALWHMGDFDDDGFVGPADAAILTANWGYGTSESVSDAVPEPVLNIFVIAGLLAGAMANRRRRHEEA